MHPAPRAARVLALALAIVAPPTHAANAKDRPAKPSVVRGAVQETAGPALSPAAFKVERHTLKNGLVVLTHEDHAVPACTFWQWFKVGSRNEAPGTTGISHYFEHMMFNGSENAPLKEYDKILESNGGYSNVFTDRDMTAYYEDIASDRLDVAFRLDSDRMASLSLLPEQLKSEMSRTPAPSRAPWISSWWRATSSASPISRPTLPKRWCSSPRPGSSSTTWTKRRPAGSPARPATTSSGPSLGRTSTPVLAALAPTAGGALTSRAVLWCVRAALALAILVFVPGLREGFEPPKAAVVRVCGLGLLVAAAGLPGSRHRHAGTLLDLAVAGWLIVELLATGFSVSPLVSLVGEPVQREGLLTSLGLAGLYVATRATAGQAQPSALEGTLRWIIVAAVGAAIYALAQSAGLDPLRWVRSATYMRGGEAVRPFGTLGHPNLLGVVTACAGSLAVALATAERRGRAWLAAAALLLAAATLVTLSRGAWLAAGAGVIVGATLAISARPGARSVRRAAIVAGGAVVSLAGVLWAAGWGLRLAARTQDLLHPMTSSSGSSRVEIWQTSWQAWLARPLLGHGPDTFELIFPRFQTEAYWRYEWGGLPFHAHSIYLHALATRGVLGIVSGALLVVAAAIAGRAAWRRGPEARSLVAALTALLTVCAVAGLFGALGVAGAALAVVGGAFLANLASAPVAVVLELRPHRPGRRRVAVAAGLVMAALATGLAVADLRGSAAGRAAEDALELARASVGEASTQARMRALEAATLAARRSPVDDVMHRLRAEALLAVAAIAPHPRPLLDDAERAARRAVAMVPVRAVEHEQLARVLAARVVSGDTAAVEGADAAIGRMAQLAPANALLLVEGARLELLIGHPEHARSLARGVTALYPDDARAEGVLAEAALAQGDAAQAEAALRRAFAGQWHGDSAALNAARGLRERLRSPATPRRASRSRGR